MKTFAGFQILGRIGKVREVGQTTRVSICANYAFKDRNGDTKDRPYWNEVTIWTERARKYVRDYVKPGDLVVARGTLKQGSFEKDREKVYTVDLNCDDFSILASAKTDKSDTDEAVAAPEAQKKTADAGRSSPPNRESGNCSASCSKTIDLPKAPSIKGNAHDRI